MLLWSLFRLHDSLNRQTSMKKEALYSSTQRSRSRRSAAAGAGVQAPGRAPQPRRPAADGFHAFSLRHRTVLLVFAGMLIALVPVLAFQLMQEAPQEITQDDIDAAVVHTIENKSLPSRAARAAEAVRQSVVSVRGYSDELVGATDPRKQQGVDKKGSEDKGSDSKAAGNKAAENRAAENRAAENRAAENRAAGNKAAEDKAAGKESVEKKDAENKSAQNKGAESQDDEKKGRDRPSGIGSGVVIVDRGIILTNLHVVQGMKRVVITFYDGTESEADLVSVHPENDLAVLRARTIPDDLPAATLGSAASLKPGDEVVAVGFPFGIGPSISAGVVSGLNREFRSPQGQRVLTQLIQFDAAANPGNSGGPLVNMDGDVVGIVTAIYTGSEARTFIGIGFAATIAVAGNLVGISPF